MDMCPEKERYSRETLSLMNKYEFNNEQVDHRLMVKEYSRSSADQDLPLPNELRPINVLIETMLYLIDEIIPQIVFDNNNNNDNFSVGDWYDFVWNRTRSIRKDIIQQRLLLNDNNTINNNTNNSISNNDYLVKNGLGGVIIIEQCARFHIMCAHRLCEQSSNVFDFKINEENLKNCFQSLRQYYEINNTTLNEQQQQSVSSSSIPSPNEAEFRSYIILLNLNESNILCEIQRWPDYIRNSKHVKFSLKVYFAYNSKNYVRFFRLIKSNECEYLQACILHRYFYKVRSDAFKSIFTAFKDQKERTFPLVRLNELLGFDNQDYQEINDYCGEFGLELDESNTNIIMPSILSYACFKLPKVNEDRLKAHRSHFIDEKFELDLKLKKLTPEKCLSFTIAGSAFQNTTGYFEYESDYTLTTCFNQDDYYNSNEIDQMYEYAKQKKANDISALTMFRQDQASTNNRSTTSFLSKLNSKKMDPNKSSSVAKKIASQILKKSKKIIQPSDLGANNTDSIPESDQMRRKGSTSSSSSTDSKRKVTKRTNELFPEKPKPLMSSETSIFNRQAPIFKPAMMNPPQSVASSSTTTTSGLFSSSTKPLTNPFDLISSSAKLTTNNEPNLFSRLMQKTAVNEPSTTTTTTTITTSHMLPKPNFTNFPLFQKPIETPATSTTFTQPNQAQQTSLFENQLKKLDQDDYATRKEKILNQKSESFFENIYLSIVKEISAEFMFTHKEMPQTIFSTLVDEQVKQVCDEILPVLKTNERTKLEQEQMKKQLELKRREEERIYFDQINSVLEFTYDSILHEVICEFCEKYLEISRTTEMKLYDEIIGDVFQKEFDIIFKQVAVELHNEITLDRLAECVYFNNEYFDGAEETIKEDEQDTEQQKQSAISLGIYSFFHIYAQSFSENRF